MAREDSVADFLLEHHFTSSVSCIYIRFNGPCPHVVLAGKGKAVPLQPWTDPEGSRRLRLPDFKTIDT
jgi:hypothetical protein